MPTKYPSTIKAPFKDIVWFLRYSQVNIQSTRRPQNLIPADIRKKCAECAQHIQGHCILALIQPSESVQINGLEAVQSEEGWIFIISHSKF